MIDVRPLDNDIITTNSNWHCPVSGIVRWSNQMQRLEVSDQDSWVELKIPPAYVGLSPESHKAIEWAKEKMVKEETIDALCQKHPGLAELRDKFEMMQRLLSQDTV